MGAQTVSPWATVLLILSPTLSFPSKFPDGCTLNASSEKRKKKNPFKYQVGIVLHINCFITQQENIFLSQTRKHIERDFVLPKVLSSQQILELEFTSIDLYLFHCLYQANLKQIIFVIVLSCVLKPSNHFINIGKCWQHPKVLMFSQLKSTIILIVQVW